MVLDLGFKLYNDNVCTTFSRVSSLYYIHSHGQILSKFYPNLGLKTYASIFQTKTNEKYSSRVIEPLYYIYAHSLRKMSLI